MVRLAKEKLDFFIEQKHINYSRASATQIKHCNRMGIFEEKSTYFNNDFKGCIME